MLKFASTYREPIDKITGDQSLKLREYELNEWKIVEELRDTLKVCFFFFLFFLLSINFILLQIFKTVTLEFSTDTLCITNIIPAMDRMHENLQAACSNEELSDRICAALKIGMNLLNKYYLITDNSELYRIAINMLHMMSPFIL